MIGVDYVQELVAGLNGCSNSASLVETIERGEACLKSKEDDPLIRCEYVTERGWPAWYLESKEGAQYKLRVIADRAQADRIAEFHSYTEYIRWSYAPKLIRRCGSAFLTEWIPGCRVGTASGGQRVRYIAHVAQALASLHVGSSRDCWLLCGADRFNTIVNEDGDVKFVDLESVRRGNPAVDLAWSEALFCRNANEVQELREEYRRLGGILLSPKVRIEGRKEFLKWLNENLRMALMRHPADRTIQSDIEAIEAALERGPIASLFW